MAIGNNYNRGSKLGTPTHPDIAHCQAALMIRVRSFVFQMARSCIAITAPWFQQL